MLHNPMVSTYGLEEFSVGRNIYVRTAETVHKSRVKRLGPARAQPPWALKTFSLFGALPGDLAWQAGLVGP